MDENLVPIERSQLRRLAEQQIGDSLDEVEEESHSLAEARHRYHELKVHKIELEIQNTELCTARNDLESMLNKYTELYDFAPISYLTLDSGGLISNINVAGSILLGLEWRPPLKDRYFAEFIDGPDLPSYTTFLHKVFSNPTEETCQVALRVAGKAPIFVRIDAVAAASGLECRFAMFDKTEQMQAEVALRKVEAAADVAFRKLDAVAGVARRKVEVVADLARRKVEAAADVALHGERDSSEVAFQKVADAAVLAFQTVEDAAAVALETLETAAGVAHLKLGDAAKVAHAGEGETSAAVKKAAEVAQELVENTAEVARQKVKETAVLMLRALRRAAEGEAQIKFAEERLRHEELLFHAQKLESLGVLAGGIAHDFNNILTGVLGNITLAQMFLDETHKAFQPLAFAEKAGLRAAALASQLLTFAKGGAPVRRPLSLTPLIEESVSLALHGSNVRCVVHPGEDLLNVEADEGQLSQVFNNIIINATQAMPDGGTLTISTENVALPAENDLGLSPGTYVRIIFSDEGCGMSKVAQSKAFDPYYTTKPTGSGLGLASVYSVIRKHGGHINLRSEVGCGATFTIHLPSTEVAINPAMSCVLRSENRGKQAGKVLILDDEAAIRDLATQILQQMGYRAVSCGKGEDAISLYNAALESGMPFQAAIIDLTLPGGMGGKETAKRILAVDPDARLIVSSGYSNDPVMASFGDYGFCAALTKPYRVPDLAQAMTDITLNKCCRNSCPEPG
jgi:signal transduction histidine kinase/CheY-like chemotaxis protein